MVIVKGIFLHRSGVEGNDGFKHPLLRLVWFSSYDIRISN
jgi:hypothetical protein